jgi:flavin reductase (DIM6/NTAB) family NADH-FMN oxidoreductase RutF
MSVMNTAVKMGQRSLRQVLSHFVTGVSVVTCLAGSEPAGMTVNSFTSVSLDPALVLFCAGETSRTGRRVLDAGAFAVNILGRHQHHLAARFASTSGDRFAEIPTRSGMTGSPILTGSLAFIDCRVVDATWHGDHVIIIGEVADAAILGEGEPLTFFQGRFLP